MKHAQHCIIVIISSHHNTTTFCQTPKAPYRKPNPVEDKAQICMHSNMRMCRDCWWDIYIMDHPMPGASGCQAGKCDDIRL
eukprot:5835926-Amphidinium_carterae.1